LWNPVTAETTVLTDYSADNKRTNCTVSLSGYGSVFVIFSKELPSKAGVFSSTKSVEATENARLNLAGPWDVRFSFGYGFDPIQQFDSLIDWRNHPNKALSSYSGLASYKLAFNVSKDYLSANKDFSIDLGKVGEVARVFLNGVEVGTSVFPPHILKLNNVLRVGENNIVIEVANTWLNQYLADLKRSPEQKLLNTNVGKGDFLKAGATPLASGLIGPVQIVASK
jgi:hypothetical protein